MATHITASRLLPEIQASVRDLDNWIGRLDLSTKFRAREPGKARLFNRWNAIELGMIAALVRGGAAPGVAALFARPLVEDADRNHQREYFVFAAGDLKQAIGTNSLDSIDEIAAKYPGKTLSLVPVGAIVRAIDKLFDEAE